MQASNWPCRLERAIRAGQPQTPHRARRIRQSVNDAKIKVVGDAVYCREVQA